MALVSVILFLFYVNSLTTASDPCYNYDDLNADITRSPSNNESVYAQARCDATLSEKWYRILGDAGTDLTNDSGLIVDHGCSTYTQMWMDGTIPEMADGTVDRTVCLKTVFSDCHDSFTIQVKNCCNFRVYNLKSANACPNSYCISNTSVESVTCPTTTTEATTTTEETTTNTVTATGYSVTTDSGHTTTGSKHQTVDGSNAKTGKETTVAIIILIVFGLLFFCVLLGVIIRLRLKMIKKSTVSLVNSENCDPPPYHLHAHQNSDNRNHQPDAQRNDLDMASGQVAKGGVPEISQQVFEKPSNLVSVPPRSHSYQNYVGRNHQPVANDVGLDRASGCEVTKGEELQIPQQENGKPSDLNSVPAQSHEQNTTKGAISPMQQETEQPSGLNSVPPSSNEHPNRHQAQVNRNEQSVAIGGGSERETGCDTTKMETPVEMSTRSDSINVSVKYTTESVNKIGVARDNGLTLQVSIRRT